jgi:hypothetical protein
VKGQTCQKDDTGNKFDRRIAFTILREGWDKLG